MERKEKHQALFPAHCTSVCTTDHQEVTNDNLEEILGVTPFEQHPYFELGDTLSVFYFHGGSLKNSGTLTIWHNRNQAAIKTSETALCGEWIETLRLIVSDQQEVGWTMKGELVTGRIAVDVSGTHGIYSCGQFFPNSPEQLAVGY